MNFLTIAGIRESLEYVCNNPELKYTISGDYKGLIVPPEDFSSEQKYSLFLIQKLTPKLIVQYDKTKTGLTLDGQELLDILSDEPYLNKVYEGLKKIGYSNPSDRQVFREVRRRMEITDFNSVSQGGAKGLFLDFFNAAKEVNLSQALLSPIGTANDLNLEVKEELQILENKSEEALEPGLVVNVPEPAEIEEKPVVEKTSIGSGLVNSTPSINAKNERGNGRKNRS